MNNPDAEAKETAREEREASSYEDIQESCRDKEAADRIGGHFWTNI